MHSTAHFAPRLTLLLISPSPCCCLFPTIGPPPPAGTEAALKEEEAEADEELAELVGDADIDPEVAAANAKLVEDFKAKMKVGGAGVRAGGWTGGWVGASTE